MEDDALNRIHNDIGILKQIFDSISEGVVVHDSQGVIAHFNQAALAILGLSAEELTGKTSQDPRWQAKKEDGTPFGKDEHPAAVTRVTKAPVKNCLMNVSRADGANRWLSVSSDIFKVNTGEFFVVATFADVTDLKIAKDKLQVQQERWRMGFKASRIGIWEYDLVSNVLHWDDEMFRLYGRDPNGFEGAYIAWQKGLHEDDRARYEHDVAQALDGTKAFDTKFRVRTPTGEVRWIKAIAEVSRDGAGKPLKMIGANIDVSRFEEVEQLAEMKSKELRREMERFELVEEGSSVGIWDWIDVNQSKEYWSPKFYKVLGYEVGELDACLESFTALLHPEDREPTFHKVRQHFAGKGRFEIEYRLRMKSGDYRWFLGTGHVSRDSSGRPVRMVGSIQDVHERKCFEERAAMAAIAASFVESILKSSPVIKVATDNEGLVTLFNQAAEKALGCLSADVVGKKHAREFLDSVGVEAYESKVAETTGQKVDHQGTTASQKALSGEKKLREFDFIRGDGKRFPAEVSIAALRTIDGTISGYLINANDISERKRAEMQAFEASHRITQAFEAAPNGMMTVRADGVIAFANKAMTEMFGYSVEEIVGMNVDNLVPANIRETHNKRRDSFFASPMKRPLGVGMTLFGSKKSGVEFPVEIGLSPMRSGDSDFVLVSVVDITERKRNESKIAATLAELERSNAELESFAYIASHDLQAPLRHISSYADLLASKLNLDADPETAKWMGYIFDGTQTMKKLIDGLLTYSRVRGKEKGVETVDLHGIVSKIATISMSACPDLTIEMPELPIVQGYASLLQQLFQNLIQNAVKFRRETVALRVEIRYSDQSSKHYFEVRDNGIGIPKEQFDRVFQLFQRLHKKEKYEGTGIGLSICKKVVSLHGGKIWIESEVGSGTAFCFTLKKSEGVT